VEKCGTLGKVRATLKKVRHAWKNAPHLEEGAKPEKEQHTYKKDATLSKMFHT